MRHVLWKALLCSTLGLMVGCAQTSQYTSKDLTILPCESRANEFFFPLEFDEAGNQVYADQAPAIQNALHDLQRVYVFVHGWNKSPKLAEGDYQDLICRFYTHSKRDEASAKRSIIIGVFWPSSGFPPLVNFWSMKSRADELAITGFQSLLELLANPSIESGGHYDLVLIGHSFGGRIILKGITHYISRLSPGRHRFLSSLNQLQLILLNTAMGEFIFHSQLGLLGNIDVLKLKREWNSQAFLREMVNQYGRDFTRKELLKDVLHLQLQWHPSLVELSGLTDFRIYNIFSTHDHANRFLYPMGSLMETGPIACAIGSCGVSQWPDQVTATAAGSLESPMNLAQSNLWNVNASNVIFSHTDIYKGRVANLVWELIALPHPQYAQILTPKYLPSSPQFFIWPGLRYEDTAYYNGQAMKEINQYRQMGEAGLKSVKELSRLAFGVDEELRKRNWLAAEQGIREIAKLTYFYPGWNVQFDFGFIEKGLLFNSQTVRALWIPLHAGSLHLLLAHVLAKQGRCEEAGQEERMVGGIGELRYFTEGALTSWDFQPKNFQPERIRMLNCYVSSQQ